MADPVYTTTDAVMRRLKGRLTASSAQSLGHTTIDPEFLSQVIEQAEARLEAGLRKHYKLPLESSHPLLAEYVELRAVCAIIPTYFQRQNVSDDRGIGNLACEEAEKLLAQLSSGMIELPGEEYRLEPDRVVSGPTIVTQRGAGRSRGTYPPESDRNRYQRITNTEDIRF